MKNIYIKNAIHELSKLIIGALTFVSALAWNEAFSDYFKSNKYLKGKGLWYYALSISIISVTIITAISMVTKTTTSFLLVLFVILFISTSYYLIHDKNDIYKEAYSINSVDN